MCYYYMIIAKPPFTKPPFVNSRGDGDAAGSSAPAASHQQSSGVRLSKPEKSEQGVEGVQNCRQIQP